MKLECVFCKKRCEQSFIPSGWKGIRAVNSQKKEFWRSHMGFCRECAEKFNVEDKELKK